jgi:hypothetical protein
VLQQALEETKALAMAVNNEVKGSIEDNAKEAARTKKLLELTMRLDFKVYTTHHTPRSYCSSYCRQLPWRLR